MARFSRVIAIDKAPFQVLREGNLQTVNLDFSDEKSLASFVDSQNVDGVYPMSDHAIIPASNLVSTYSFVGLGPECASAFLDKSKMRTIWGDAGLQQPAFIAVETSDEAIAAAEQLGYPVVLKPAASGGGGRGVLRVDQRSQVAPAYAHAQAENRYSKIVLVETFIEGIESSIEMSYLDQEASLIALSTKTKAESRHQVATEIVYPGEIAHPTVDKIQELCYQAGLALGMRNGLCHFEVITHNRDEPFLVEVGARAGGGHTFHPIASHVAGFSYPGFAAHLYLGQFDDAQKMLAEVKQERGAVYAFPVSKREGIVKEIGFSRTDEITSDFITEVWKPVGSVLTGLNSSLDRLGCIVTMAEDLSIARSDSHRLLDGFTLQIQEREPTGKQFD